MKTKLHIGKSAFTGKPFYLDLDCSSMTWGTVAAKGYGKTFSSGVLNEEFLEAGLPTIILDPTGVWWGLRLAADGKGKGYDIPIFGGDKADIPLEPTAGEVVAEYLVANRQSAILDLSLFHTKADQNRFIAAFASKLYRLKAHQGNRWAMHLTLDEAEQFLPQDKDEKGDNNVLAAFKQIANMGRSRGFGLSFITLRPQMVSTNIRDHADPLFCGHLVGPHARSAIERWAKAYGTKEQVASMMNSLSTLPRGHFWIWSPELRIFEVVEIRPKRTYDSSYTPKASDKPKPAKQITPLEVKNLTAAIAESRERIEASNPDKLRAKIKQLESQLAAKNGQPATNPQQLRELKAAFEAERQTMMDTIKRRGVIIDDYSRRLESIRQLAVETISAEQIAKMAARIKTAKPRDFVEWPLRPDVPPQEAAELMEAADKGTQTAAQRKRVDELLHNRPAVKESPREFASRVRRGEPRDGDQKPLRKGAMRMLIALAQRPQGLTRSQLSARSMVAANGGSFGTYLSDLRTRGLIAERGGVISITDQGVDEAGDFEPLPSGAALVDYWCGQLRAGAARMLRELVNVHPETVSDHELGIMSDVSTSGGSFGTYLSDLRTRQLIEGPRDALRAVDELID